MNSMRSLRPHETRLSRDGFSIPELLVALGIIGLLSALVMPAVQASRERARETACRNNLRQIALACFEHDATHGTFPYTSQISRPWFAAQRLNAVSPHTRLLPFLAPDVASRHDDSDKTALVMSKSRPFTRNAKNKPLIDHRIPTFVCPSDEGPRGANSYRANLGISPHWTTGVAGRFPSAMRGAFANAKAIRPDEFTDGQSNTALFSEKLIGDGNPLVYTPWRDRYIAPYALHHREEAIRVCRDTATANPAQHDSYGGYTWLYGGWSQTWYLHLVPPNSSIPDCSDDSSAGNGEGLYQASSLHAGGANCAMADGSVRLIASQIDAKIWLDHGSRNRNGD